MLVLGVAAEAPTRRHNRSLATAPGAPRGAPGARLAHRAASRSMTSNSGTLIEDADVALRREHSPIDDMP
jgi:hypothetical protein